MSRWAGHGSHIYHQDLTFDANASNVCVCVFTSEYEQVTIATQKNLSHLGMKCIKDGHGLPLAESIGS